MAKDWPSLNEVSTPLVLTTSGIAVLIAIILFMALRPGRPASTNKEEKKSAASPSKLETMSKAFQAHEEEERRNASLPVKSLKELRSHCESTGALWISLVGIIYDVEGGRNFYGPEGPYSLLVGNEVSYVLAKGGLAPNALDLNKSVAKLDLSEKASLESWRQRISSKYPAVARLPDTEMAELSLDSLKSYLNSGKAQEEAPTPSEKDAQAELRGQEEPRCPLGFGSAPKRHVRKAPDAAERKFSLESLKGEGKHLISLMGTVFDCSNNPEAIPAHFYGHEISLASLKGSHLYLSMPLGDSLSYEDQKKLFDLRVKLEQLYTIVGQLDAVTMQAFFTEVPADFTPTAITAPPLPAETEAQRQGPNGDVQGLSQRVHAAVEQGNLDQLTAALEKSKEFVAVIDNKCPRTEMTPLHKAIEAGWTDGVSTLLKYGADPTLKASLYDNNNSVDLAERFKRPDLAEMAKPYFVMRTAGTVAGDLSQKTAAEEQPESSVPSIAA